MLESVTPASALTLPVSWSHLCWRFDVSTVKECARCGQTFVADRVRAKYCSRGCASPAIAVTVACAVCNKSFSGSPARVGLMCSRACRYASMRKRVRFTCAHCSAAFESRPNRVGKTKYCSKRCKYAASVTLVVLGCATCRAQFSAAKDAATRRRYCSLACSRVSSSNEELFWRNVERGQDPDICWLWNGTRSHGYGVATFDKRRTRATHVSLALHGRPRPPGLCALHTCDNPPCVNPGHLYWGTQLDNSKDCVDRGRHRTARGSKSRRAKLTEAIVVAIRTKFVSEPTDVTATRFGVSRCHVRAVRNGSCWKHVRTGLRNIKSLANDIDAGEEGLPDDEPPSAA